LDYFGKLIEKVGFITDRVDKLGNRFQMADAMSSWLLATCSWHDSANYLTLIL